MLLTSRLRFVLTIGVSGAEVTLNRLALAETKQIRPDAVGPFGSVAAHFVLCRQGRRYNRLRRDRDVGENHPRNVRSDARSPTFHATMSDVGVSVGHHIFWTGKC